MFCLPRTILLGVTLTLGAFAQSAPQNDSTLGRLLTPEEFRAAGLNKLTPNELAHLAVALQHHGLQTGSDIIPVATAAQSPTTPAPRVGENSAAAFGEEQVVREKPAGTPNELRSRIEGTLEEISGRAVFVLENGQVWQQRIPDSVHFSHKLANPEVVISRSFGGYKMLIVPANRVIFVKRIQ